MDNLQLQIQAPPFVRAGHTTQRIMIMVIVALIPAIIAGYYYFGVAALRHIVYSTLAAVLAELLIQWLLRRPITVLDGSAAVTGLLIGLGLPPAAPLWIGPVGALIAIIIVKQVFGGLGSNFVNPALAARAFMVASWPSQMVAFVKPFDAVTAATPLSLVSGSDALRTVPSLMQLFMGDIAGCIGETCALALLVGGIFLVFFEVIDYRIPVGMLATIFVLGSCFAGPLYTFGFSLSSGLYQMLSGGAVLAAFFMATDYVTSPVTGRGRWIYGMAIGLIIVLIRFWGRYPEGVTFAVLLMNIATPLIERFTRPRKFGEVSASAK